MDSDITYYFDNYFCFQTNLIIFFSSKLFRSKTQNIRYKGEGSDIQVIMKTMYYIVIKMFNDRKNMYKVEFFYKIHKQDIGKGRDPG